MAAPTTELSLESIRLYILGKGGQVTNQEIAKHFKKFLKDSKKPELKVRFKDYVNTVAVVKTINDEKLIMLRKEYRYPPAEPQFVRKSPPQRTSSSLDALDNDVFYDPQPLGLPAEPPRNPLNHSQSSPNISTSTESEDVDEQKSPHPTAPPRRKSTREQKKSQASLPPSEPTTPNNVVDENAEILPAPRFSVKEQAKKLNKIVSESQLNLQLPRSQSKKSLNATDDDDSSSIATSDPRCREWLLNSARGDYVALTRLLRDEPRLAKHKDIIYGTALHWAAKRGNCDVVKLIAGTHGLDVNIRSGYTPLHLSAIHDHRNVYDLLVKTYKADEKMPDYSGKIARQLFKDAKKGNFEGKSEPRHHQQRRTNDRDGGFLRIGSLNVKVRKTNQVLTRFENSLHKTWGSAESIPEKNEKYAMAPPKFLPAGRRRKIKRPAPKSDFANIAQSNCDSDSSLTVMEVKL